MRRAIPRVEMPRPRANRRCAFGVVSCIALGSMACLDPIAPGEMEIGMVHVTIGSRGVEVDTIQVRATTRVQAVALAREGYDVGVTNFRYASSDTLVATVDSLGTVRGVAPGQSTITATAPGGESGSARVVVQPSTIAYTIRVGSAPGAIAFSTDFTRAYIAAASDSIVIVDALGFFRIGAIGLGLAVGSVAATSTRIYATHPFADSVSLIATGTNEPIGRVWVGAGPHGVVAAGERAFVAARWDRRIVTIDGSTPGVAIPVAGEPTELAIAGNGARLFAAVKRPSAWHLVFIDPQFPDTVSSIALRGEPAAITTNGDGSRIWVLRAGSGQVDSYRVEPSGVLSLAGSAAVGAGGTGIAARPVGPAYVIVSGDPAVVLQGESMTVLESITGAGQGRAAVRPDGLFAFLTAPVSGLLHVIGM